MFFFSRQLKGHIKICHSVLYEKNFWQKKGGQEKVINTIQVI